LHVPTLRRQPALALQLQERLRRDDRIRHVGASAITGNVLVLFDRSRLDLREVRRQLELEAATYRPVRAFGARDESLSRRQPASESPAWQTREAADVIRALNEDPASGLSGKEAKSRLAAS